jgi:serine protease inhibitor
VTGRRAAVPLALMALLAGCSSPTTENEGPPPLLQALPRSLSATESGLVTAGNQFGFDLLREVRRADPDSTIFLSPMSASMALGMTLSGAAGTTLDSLRVALRLGSAPVEEINAAYRSLIDLLRGLDETSQFRIANSIWAQAGFPFLQPFLDAGRTNFDAEIRNVDFAAPATLQAINDWARDKTNGKIPSILDQIGDEVMFLINAIYFKGSWRLAFDPKDTHPAPFHDVDGTTHDVPTMSLHPETTHRYAFTRDAEILELLYGNGAFAMTIVLPSRDRTLADATAGLDAARWAEWIGALQDQKMGLTLPKFRVEYKRELKDDLSALGMRIAFDPDRADFSGMANIAPDRLYITRVTQKTFVDVNEEGTEAAAVTAVGIGPTSAPPTMTVDRPFLFAIRERFSGTILFLGQITRIP